MRPRMGFALVRIVAPRRRQDPIHSEYARLEWGPADRGLRCTNAILTLGNQYTSSPNPPDMRWRRAVLRYRCDWFVPS